jgi:hypothetical protein
VAPFGITNYSIYGGTQMNTSKHMVRRHGSNERILDEQRQLNHILNNLPIITLHQVFSDAELLQSYISFCTREHSDENILFYCCVNEFKANAMNERNKEYLQYWAEYIFNQFLVPQSEFEIPCAPRIRESIRRELQFPHPQMFDILQYTIYGLLQGDSGLRYLKSWDYCNIILKRLPSEEQRKQLKCGDLKLDRIPSMNHQYGGTGTGSGSVNNSSDEGDDTLAVVGDKSKKRDKSTGTGSKGTTPNTGYRRTAAAAGGGNGNDSRRSTG